MGDDPGPLPPIGIGKSALIGINPVCEPKIVKVANDAVPGGGSDELRPACGKAALYQQPWNGSKNSPENECFLPRRSQEAECNVFNSAKNPSASAVVAAALSCNGP